MRLLARRIGILALKRKELEDAIKELKTQLAPHLRREQIEETKDGREHHVLTDVDGFTCKLYDRTQLFADQKVARKLLHANTFNAIFKPSTAEIVDVRPTAATKRLAVDILMSELEEDELAQAS